MSHILIKNGHIIDPEQSVDRTGHVVVQDGLIKDVLFEDDSNEALKVTFDRVIDASGCIVSPGFIDMHVHLRDPGQLHKEDITSGTKAAVAGGFTSVLCMPNTKPTNDCADVTSYMIQKAKSEGFCKVYPVGALSKGLQGKELADIHEMFEAGCIAFSDDGRPCHDTMLFRKAMEAASEVGALVIEHCEDVHLTHGRVTIHEGEVSKKLGFNGITASSETSDVARTLVLASETGTKLHLAHMSCAQSIELIQTVKKSSDKITCEVCPHHLVLTVDAVERLGTQAKMYPPLREQKDLDILQEALASGLVDVIATDHAPHTPEEKNVEFPKAPNGVIGLQTALPVMLTLVHRGVISLNDLIKMMTTRPAAILGLKAGALKKGWPADVAVFTIGREYDLAEMKQFSKSKNTPFSGFKGKGDIEYTFVDGKCVYERGRA